MADAALVDTNIFIEIFRNRDNVLQSIIDFRPNLYQHHSIFELVRGEPNKERYLAMET